MVNLNLVDIVILNNIRIYFFEILIKIYYKVLEFLILFDK